MIEGDSFGREEETFKTVHRLSANERKKDMIRIVRDEDGHLELDTTGRKNGRGAYICNTEECLEKGICHERP